MSPPSHPPEDAPALPAARPEAAPRAAGASRPRELQLRFEAVRRGVPFLVYREGDGPQRIVTLDGADALAIGRQPSCEIPLVADPEVSRVHAILERVGSEWTLVDDGSSRNGTFLDGVRLHGRRRLGDGDSIRVGSTTLEFVVPAEQAGLGATAVASAGLRPELSPAQRRVLVALCRPLVVDRYAAPGTNQQIADDLVLGVETVKTHLRTLFAIFGVGPLPQNQKRAALARTALELGVVDHDELAAGR